MIPPRPITPMRMSISKRLVIDEETGAAMAARARLNRLGRQGIYAADDDQCR